MMKRAIAVAAAALFLLATGAHAQEATSGRPSGALAARTGYLNLGVGLGYMFDPDMTAATVSLDYFITDDIAVGPCFHAGGAGNNSYWGVTGQVKYSPALVDNPGVRPYATIGIGFADTDFEGDGEEDVSYLFPIGGGLEFELNDILTLDAGALFEITDDSFVGLMVGIKVIL